MTDEKILEMQIKLDSIKDALRKNRSPYMERGVSICKTPTLAEWAAEEMTDVLLNLLEDLKMEEHRDG